MAQTLDVLTLAEGKAAAKLSGTVVYDATLLPAWITGISLRLDKLVGPIVQRTVTAEKHSGGRKRIFLHHHPITSISSVVEYSGTVGLTLAEETNATKPDGYIVEDYSANPTYLSNIVRRRIGGWDAVFAAGRRNVETSYVAGRFATTAAVDERFKRAASLTLINLWRSHQESTGQVGEFDVPFANFPTFAIPKAVRELFPGEIQDPTPL